MQSPSTSLGASTMHVFSYKNRVAVLIAALLLVFALNIFSVNVRGFFVGVLSPVQGFFWDLGQTGSHFFSGLFNAASLKKENIAIEERMLAFQQELVSLQDVEKENEQLRNALGLGIEKEFSILSARIVGKDPSQDILFLNRGSKDGVQKGMAVITPEKVAVGRVEKVFESASRVMLFSHQASSFEAKILKEGVVGAVQGQGRHQALLDLIPQESAVVSGDIVVSASLGGVFPENLLIGEVKEVRASQEKSFQQATLSLFFNVRKAGLLFLIKNR